MKRHFINLWNISWNNVGTISAIHMGIYVFKYKYFGFIALFRSTINSRYLDISNTLYLELCPNSNKTLSPFSINSSRVTTRYLELSISRTFYPVPWEFEISRVDCYYQILKVIPLNIWQLYFLNLKLSNHFLMSIISPQLYSPQLTVSEFLFWNIRQWGWSMINWQRKSA